MNKTIILFILVILYNFKAYDALFNVKIPILSSGIIKRTNNRLVPLKFSHNDMNVSTDEKSDYSKNLVNTGQWFLASTVVCGAISKIKGVESSIEFASGYFLEQALSIDNLFVFILIFKYFKIPKELEQKVLNYGILGGTLYVIYISRLHSILFYCLNFSSHFTKGDIHSGRISCFRKFSSNFVTVFCNTWLCFLWYTFFF